VLGSADFLTKENLPMKTMMPPMKKPAGKPGAFKPCSGCPNPAKCKAAGKCLAKKK
jgi:hypothetical protein